jgi:hypothetical protein
MTGISLRMQWSLTSQLQGSVSQREQFFSLWIKLNPLIRLGVYLPCYPMGHWLLWAASWKWQKYPTYLGCCILWISFSINFDKKSVGLHFGRFFHKLIWSPWTWIKCDKTVRRKKSKCVTFLLLPQ